MSEINDKDILIVRYIYFTRLLRQVLATNPQSWQDNNDYRKVSLDYATLWRAFRNCFILF